MFCIFIDKNNNNIVKVINEKFDETTCNDTTGGFITRLHYTSIQYPSVMAISECKINIDNKQIQTYCVGIDGYDENEVSDKSESMQKIISLLPAIMKPVFEANNGLYRFLSKHEVADLFDISDRVDLSNYSRIKITNKSWNYTPSLSEQDSIQALSCVLSDETGVFIAPTIIPTIAASEINIFINKEKVTVCPQGLMEFCHYMSNYIETLCKNKSNIIERGDIVPIVDNALTQSGIFDPYNDLENYMIFSGFSGKIELLDCGSDIPSIDSVDSKLWKYIKYHDNVPFVLDYRITKSDRYMLTLIMKTVYMDEKDLSQLIRSLNGLTESLGYHPKVYVAVYELIDKIINKHTKCEEINYES